MGLAGRGIALLITCDSLSLWNRDIQQPLALKISKDSPEGGRGKGEGGKGEEREREDGKRESKERCSQDGEVQTTVGSATDVEIDETSKKIWPLAPKTDCSSRTRNCQPSDT